MNHVWNIICVAIVTFLFATFATGLVRRHALRNAILDIPNVRSSHVTPTPRGGGLAMVIAFMGALVFLVVGRTAAIQHDAGADRGRRCGCIDGVFGRSQFLAREHSNLRSHRCCDIGGDARGWYRRADTSASRVAWRFGPAVCLAVAALIWSTNLFNFMDGIDGIAGSEAVFMAGAGALLNWKFGGDDGLTAAMLVLAAATLGFLIWNWPPARIFMGDVGSGFLGFTLAVLGLAASRQGTTPIEVWVILSGVFIVDATVTLVRRIVRGDRWFEAHRLHAYQNLASRWQRHWPVTVSVIAINICWLFPWAWFAATHPASAMSYMITALAPLIIIALLVGAGRTSRR